MWITSVHILLQVSYDMTTDSISGTQLRRSTV